MRITYAFCFALVLFLIGTSGAQAFALPEGAQSKFAEVNGIRMHYVEMGEGPVLVLLHGWPQTWVEWAPLMPKLSEHFTVIAPDMRGIGKTERTEDGYDKATQAKDIAALIKHVSGSEPATVVGHDMGGKVAFVLGLTEPQLIDTLVLIDCVPPGSENMDARNGGLWHYGFHMAPDIPEMLTKGREHEYLTAMMMLLSGGKNVMSDEAIEAYVAAYSEPGAMTAGFNNYRTLREDGAFIATLKDKRLTMPVLAIGGENAVSHHLYDALKTRADDLTGVVAKGAGHYVPEEQPGFVADQIIDFAVPP